MTIARSILFAHIGQAADEALTTDDPDALLAYSEHARMALATTLLRSLGCTPTGMAILNEWHPRYGRTLLALDPDERPDTHGSPDDALGGAWDALANALDAGDERALETLRGDDAQRALDALDAAASLALLARHRLALMARDAR